MIYEYLYILRDCVAFPFEMKDKWKRLENKGRFSLVICAPGLSDAGLYVTVLVLYVVGTDGGCHQVCYI